MSSPKRDTRGTLDDILDILLDALEERRAEQENEAPAAQLNGHAEVVDDLDLTIERTETGEQKNHLQASEVEEVVDGADSAENLDPAPVNIPDEPEISVAIAEPTPIPPDAGDEAVVSTPDGAQRRGILEWVENLGGDSAEIDLETPAEPLPSINMARTIRGLFFGILLFVIIANLPFEISQLNTLVGANPNGTTVVRYARDGLLVRASNSRKIFIMENNKPRWITTSEAFFALGHDWGDVRVVEPDYLTQFEEGEPIYLPIKCAASPHIYVLDLKSTSSPVRIKRWIQDIETFTAMGFEWEDIQAIGCSELRLYSNGDSFPSGAENVPEP